MNQSTDNAIIQAVADSLDVGLRALHVSATLAGQIDLPFKQRITRLAEELEAVSHEAERLHQHQQRKVSADELDKRGRLDDESRAVLRKVETSGTYRPSADERYTCETLTMIGLIVRGKLVNNVAETYRAKYL
jgi:hypothetical protein